MARALKVAAALALLALIAFFVMKQQRRKNRLEGELEILRPRAAPDVAFVGLPGLQAARLRSARSCRRRRWVAATRGCSYAGKRGEESVDCGAERVAARQ